MAKIAVLGGGINGVSCALKIKDKYPECELVLISEKFSPHTTGDGSGGLWYPYLVGDTPGHALVRWGGETYKYLHRLWLRGDTNICMMPMYGLYKEIQTLPYPDWGKIVFGFRHINGKHLEYLNQQYSSDYTIGLTYNTFVVHPPTLITMLLKMFTDVGGKVIPAKVTSLQDDILEKYQVVVNCTGLGARQLVPDDAVFPIRGQVAKVSAPWLYETVIDESSGNYIIPNSHTCVLGGTHQVHDNNTDLNEKDSKFVRNGCERIIPGLKHSLTLNEWAGLRPGRNEIRLESEKMNGKLIIHNYGHGGSGFTLFWGCASDVLAQFEEYYKNEHQISKL